MKTIGFLILMLLSNCLFASYSTSKDLLKTKSASYVILTNFSETSPYNTAIQQLKEYRSATIVTFQTDPLEALTELIEIQPDYVAVVTSPTTLDEGFAFKVFSLAKQLDDDFDTDFSYGFIAANTPDEVEAYIERVISYESGLTVLPKVFRCIWSTGDGALGGGIGGWGDEFSKDMVSCYYHLEMESKRVSIDSVSQEELLNNVQSSGIINLMTHGSFSIGGGFGFNNIPNYTHPILVLNNGCYGGCTSKWYDQCATDVENYEDRAIISDPESSFALNYMKNGALAYYGHMCMGGSNFWPLDLTDSLITDLSRTTGDLLVGWYNIPKGPDIISAQDTVGPGPNDYFNMDRNRFYYSAMILFGDPAVKLSNLNFINSPPSKPALLTPENGSVLRNPIYFKWQSSDSDPIDDLEYEFWYRAKGTSTWLGGLNEDRDFLEDRFNAGINEWMVTANDRFFKSQSDIWEFTVLPDPPEEPVLVSPANNLTDVALNPTLIWNGPTNATSYRLQVSLNVDFSTSVLDQSNISGMSFSLSGLNYITTYYWRVKASNQGGDSEWSEIWKFSTTISPPQTPVLINPINNATGVTRDLVLTWNASANATSYKLQVSLNVDFSTSVLDQSNISGMSFSLSGLNYSTTYYWRVKASNQGGDSEWSEIWKFSTTISPPQIPVLVTPLNNATGVTKDLVLTWNASANATSYKLQVSLNSDFSTSVLDQSNISGTSFSLSGLNYSATYYWRVKASNQGGDSEWSETWKFITGTNTSVEEISGDMQKPEILCYPNPFTQSISLEINNSQHKSYAEIYDIFGHPIEILEVSGEGVDHCLITWTPGKYLSSGIYYIIVRSETSSLKCKVIYTSY